MKIFILGSILTLSLVAQTITSQETGTPNANISNEIKLDLEDERMLLIIIVTSFKNVLDSITRKEELSSWVEKLEDLSYNLYKVRKELYARKPNQYNVYDLQKVTNYIENITAAVAGLENISPYPLDAIKDVKLTLMYLDRAAENLKGALLLQKTMDSTNMAEAFNTDLMGLIEDLKINKGEMKTKLESEIREEAIPRLQNEASKLNALSFELVEYINNFKGKFLSILNKQSGIFNTVVKRAEKVLLAASVNVAGVLGDYSGNS